LVKLWEECDEVGQRVAKALRFGLDEVQPGQGLTNAERLKDEFLDLWGAWGLLCRAGAVLPIAPMDDPLILAKQEKFEETLDYSRECKTLN
jgi:hypothetical protein